MNNKGPRLIQEIKGHKNTLLTAKFSPDNQNVIAAGVENVIYFHKLNQTNHYYKIFAHDDIIHSLDYGESKNSHFFLSASRDQTVKLWKTNSLNKKIVDQEFEPIVYRCHNNTIRFVNICPLNNTIFCTASDDKTVKIWSTTVPNKRLNTFSNHTNWIRCCKFSRKDSNLIASCGDDSTLRIFDLRLNGLRGSVIKTITTLRNRHFTYLDWYPLSEYFIAIASSNNMIRIFDLRNMAKIIQFYKPFNDSVNCLEFHKSGDYLLACSSDSTSKLINVIEGRLIYTLKSHYKAIFNCAFNSDGSQFITVGKDRSMKLWNFNLDFNYIEESDDYLSINTQTDTHRDTHRDSDEENRHLFRKESVEFNFKTNSSINPANSHAKDKSLKNRNFNKTLDRNMDGTRDRRPSKHPINRNFKQQSLINMNNLDLESLNEKNNRPTNCHFKCSSHHNISNLNNPSPHMSSNSHFSSNHLNFNQNCVNFDDSINYSSFNNTIKETNLIDLEARLINNHSHCNKHNKTHHNEHRNSTCKQYPIENRIKHKETNLLPSSELNRIFDELNLLEISLTQLERRIIYLENKLENR